MTSTPLKQRDGVVLEGVSGWAPWEMPSSIHAAQAAVMRAVDIDVSYDTLVGVSGLAFRMQLSVPGLCPSSPHACCGYQCVERSVRALPWNLRVFEIDRKNTAAVLETRRAVKESIDRGVPVQYGSEEDGIVVGYRADGQEWICLHPMHENGATMFVEKSLPWGVAVFTSPKDTTETQGTLAAEALKQAVNMAEAEQADNYFLGARAWDSYINKVNTLDDVDAKTRSEVMLGNAWIYECLVHCRGVAARYLRETASEFDPDISVHLLRAADAYEEIAGRILADATTPASSIAPYAWTLPDGQVWSSELRTDQVSRLRQAKEREGDAVEAIRHALAQM